MNQSNTRKAFPLQIPLLFTHELRETEDMRIEDHGNGSCAQLFEIERARGRLIYRSFALSVFTGICLIWVYRFWNLPPQGEDGRWGWIGLLGAELWFGLYWVLTQSLRWNLVYRRTFKDRLSQRYGNDLPGVDIFVCTADPALEPPMLVVNTVLSVMAYDYPTEKLSIYLSDDAGSDITFYALSEASDFAKHWIPYCKKFKVEPRSPAVYFSLLSSSQEDKLELVAIKNLYEDMKNRIETASKLGRIPEKPCSENSGFSQWDSYSSRRDHDAILQILLDGKARDAEGSILPTLVYLAREKRPQRHHNFKAGAMNALIRVSSGISNGQIILNVDCDMYSNSSQSVLDALCFFMDEEKGHEIAFVQFPQSFDNVTKNDVYGSSLRVISEIEFHGLDGYGGPLYIGTGCFHRRDTLCGSKFSDKYRIQWKTETDKAEKSVRDLENLKDLARCAHEDHTQWGKEMGLKYGCPVEDVITGLSIQCNGWKSVYFNPERKAFLGVAAVTLPQTLVQHKRWSEGDFQIFLSEYSPACYGRGKISTGLIMGYCCFCLWAPNCLATLCYSVVPSLFLLNGISLFPQISSPWFIPYAYVIFATSTYSLAEFLWSGGTILGWWNELRIWLYKRTSSYLFAFADTILKLLGFSESGFVISAKVADEQVLERYHEEMMDFGGSSPMLTVLATLAMVNLVCLVGVIEKMAVEVGFEVYKTKVLQVAVCGFMVLMSLPMFHGMLFRKDSGKVALSLTVKSVVFALLVCFSFLYC